MPEPSMALQTYFLFESSNKELKEASENDSVQDKWFNAMFNR